MNEWHPVWLVLLVSRDTQKNAGCDQSTWMSVYNTQHQFSDKSMISNTIERRLLYATRTSLTFHIIHRCILQLHNIFQCPTVTAIRHGWLYDLKKSISSSISAHPPNSLNSNFSKIFDNIQVSTCCGVFNEALSRPFSLHFHIQIQVQIVVPGISKLPFLEVTFNKSFQ